MGMKTMPEYIKSAYPPHGQEVDYNHMAQVCRQALATHPQDHDFLLAYEAVYLGYAGRHTDCIELCRKGLPLLKHPDCIEDMLYTLEFNLKKSGDVEGAIELLKQRAESEPENRYHHYTDIVEYYSELGDTDNIITYTLLLLEQGHVDTEVLQRLADAYDENEDYMNSFKYYVKAAQNEDDQTSWLWNNAGRALGLAGKEDEAMFYFKMALAINPKSEYAHYYMGMVYQNQKDEYRALHHYTEALKLKPGFGEVYNNLAAIQFNDNGNIKKAIEYLEEGLRHKPDNHLRFLLYQNLVTLYGKIADYDRKDYYAGKIMEMAGFEPHFESDEEDGDDLSPAED